ncbi:hypothetical protein [Actinomadura sp. HBU206391]|uniref:hypothetical protein n=1 Tax=Actinomadura sp. HBU206391 TaxID=2731692 RepID=UPI00164FF0B6|nr:hypothetical protein [Actinomadura sp. HBU206391]MBC6456579.1 hypothetical protein [Actinomadura sp. HBU206391]
MSTTPAEAASQGAGVPTMSEVDRITAHTDPVVRNLQITQCYHELSTALVTRIGRAANWCTFAVWASKQAGQTIRQEDLARHLERLLGSSPDTRDCAALVVRRLRWIIPRRVRRDADRLVLQTVAAVVGLDAAGDAAAEGNRKVFAEIAREFARFLAAFSGEQADGEHQIAEFCAALRPGDPPEGQRYLRQAFTRYHQALFTSDPKRLAELLLLANLEIGVHEQTRLQPEITAALEAPIVDPDEVERRLLDLLLPGGGLRRRLRLAILALSGRRRLLRVACEHLARHARTVARHAVTEHMMTLSLPSGQLLYLGQDLPAEFPPVLSQLSDPELLALLREIDPTTDSLLGTGARDWSDLPDRMHYIADLFRCQAQRDDLLSPPFTPEQVVAVKGGRRPSGRL